MTDQQLPTPVPDRPTRESVPPVPPAPGYEISSAASGYRSAAGGHPAPDVAYQTPPAQPAYQAPPGAYPAPVGGYSAPAGAYQPSTEATRRSPVLGIVAFVLSIVAAIVAPIIAGAAGYRIGFELPTVAQRINASTDDLSFLAPVRDHVLMGEISFWLGTIAGVAAIVLGIMAIAKRAGRAWGITGLVLAALSPVVFFTVLTVMLGFGAADGSGTI